MYRDKGDSFLDTGYRNKKYMHDVAFRILVRNSGTVGNGCGPVITHKIFSPLRS